LPRDLDPGDDRGSMFRDHVGWAPGLVITETRVRETAPYPSLITVVELGDAVARKLGRESPGRGERDLVDRGAVTTVAAGIRTWPRFL